MAESHREEIAKLESLYASNPGGRVFVHLAEALRKAGELERARSILVEGLARHTDSASGFVVLGRVLADLGSPDEAEAAFRQVLGLDSGNLVALRGLGDIARLRGRSAEAVEHYRELLSRSPSNDEVRSLLEALDAELSASAPAPADDDGAAAEDADAGFASVADDSLDDAITPYSAAPGESGPAGPAEPDFGVVELDALPGDLANLAGMEARHAADQSESDALDIDWAELENAGAPSPTGGAGEFDGDYADDPAGDSAAAYADGGEIELPDSAGADVLEAEPLELHTVSVGAEAEASETEPFEAEASGAEPFEDEPSAVEAFRAETFDADAFGAEASEHEASEAEASEAEPFEVEASGAEASEAEAFEEEPSEVEAFESGEADEPFGFEAEAFGVEPEVEAEDDAAASALGGVDVGGFGGALGGPAAPEDGGLQTETMADLYRSQGFHDRAAQVYRVLLQQRPDDERLAAKLRDAEESGSAAVAGQVESLIEEDDAGEVWLRGSAWTGPTAAAADAETPYAWTAGEEEAPADTLPAAPIGTYLRGLISWRPSAQGGAGMAEPGGLAAESSERGAESAGPAEPWADMSDGSAAAEPESASAEAAPWEAPSAHPTGGDADPWSAGSAAAEPWSSEAAEAGAGAASAETAPAWQPPARPARHTSRTVDPVQDAFDEWYSGSEGAGSGTAEPQSGEPELEREAGQPAESVAAEVEASAPDRTASSGSPAADAEEGEDDEDLAMFRTWLQSLKK